MNFGPLFISLAAFIWATDSFVRSRFEASFASAQVVFLEHVIIGIFLIPLFIKYSSDLLQFNRKEWAAILFIGIGGSALATIAFTQALFTGSYGYQYIAVIVFIQQVQPVFAIGFAHVFLKERLPQFFYLFATLSFIGVIMIVYPVLSGDAYGNIALATIINDIRGNDVIIASGLALSAAFLWGTSTVFGRYILEHGEQKPAYIQMVSYRFLIGAIFMIIFLPIYGIFKPDLGGYPSLSDIFVSKTMGYLLYVALIVGLLSLILYYYGLKSTHASVSAIFELAFPVTFYIIMPLLDIQFPSTIQILGSVLLVASATLLSYNYGKLQTENGQPTAVAN